MYSNDLPDPSDNLARVQLGFTLTSTLASLNDEGELAFIRSTEYYSLPARVPENYAYDQEALKLYLSQSLYDSGYDVVEAELITASLPIG